MKVEYLGLFSWIDPVKDLLKKKLKGFSYVKYITTRNIENINMSYMSFIAQGFKSIKIKAGSRKGDLFRFEKPTYDLSKMISQKLGIPNQFILNYFETVYILATSGVIPLSKLDPKGYQKSKTLQKTFKTEKNVFDKTSDIAKKSIIPIVALSALGLFAFLKIGKKNGN